jgi:hypothetical protein
MYLILFSLPLKYLNYTSDAECGTGFQVYNSDTKMLKTAENMVIIFQAAKNSSDAQIVGQTQWLSYSSWRKTSCQSRNQCSHEVCKKKQETIKICCKFCQEQLSCKNSVPQCKKSLNVYVSNRTAIFLKTVLLQTASNGMSLSQQSV